MKHTEAKVENIRKIKDDIYLLEFKSAYLARKATPGQFLHIKIDDKVTLLRRPFSIHKIKGVKIYILFRIRGRGTKLLSQYRRSDALDIIGPLGQGFKLNNKSKNSILVAGGIGVAPLVFLAQRIAKTENRKPKTERLVILGAKNKEEITCEADFKKMGFKVKVATDDGSRGFKGTAVGLAKKELTNNTFLDMYVCGPSQMFDEIKKTLKKHPSINCQVSFEQFMGCGIGICCGCSIKTKNGYKKVCKDGPVFNLSEI